MVRSKISILPEKKKKSCNFINKIVIKVRIYLTTLTVLTVSVIKWKIKKEILLNFFSDKQQKLQWEIDETKK